MFVSSERASFTSEAKSAIWLRKFGVSSIVRSRCAGRNCVPTKMCASACYDAGHHFNQAISKGESSRAIADQGNSAATEMSTSSKASVKSLKPQRPTSIALWRLNIVRRHAPNAFP